MRKRKMLNLFVVLYTVLSFAPCVNAAKNKGYIFPVPNYSSITQYYSSSHTGIDIGASKDTKVYASKSGTVIKKYTGCNNYSRNNGICQNGGVCSPNHGYSNGNNTKGYCNDGFGNGYIIKHSDGTWTEYAHMNSLSDSIYEGAYISQGTYLGGVGSSGNSTGPHLHFGLRTGNTSTFWSATPLNPFDYMDTDDTGTPTTPADIGTNIYTYILNKPAWKAIVCEPNGINVYLEEDKWKAYQRWYATRNDDGSYYFINAANNKYLTSSGTNVQVGDSKKKWFIYDNGDSYLIQPEGSENVLDLAGSKTTDGTNIQLCPIANNDAQAFTFYTCNPTAETPVIEQSAEYMKESGSVTISWDKTEYTKEYKYYLSEYPVKYAYSTNTKSDITPNTSITFNNLTSGYYTCFIHAVSHKGEVGSQSNWKSFKVYAEDYVPTKTVVSNNHLYALYDYEMSWSFARDLCTELGGNLVTVTSAEEDAVVTDLIQSGSKDAYWLGATDINGNDKDFVWVTDEPFSYSNWKSGEPSSSGTSGEKEHFIEIRKSYGNKWNDVNNINKTNKGFILEIDIDEYSPAATQTYNGNQYLLFDKNTTWSEADAFCKALGGHLLYTNNEEEQEFITTFIRNGQRDWYYIGGQKRNGVWEWENGSKADFINWSENAASWTGTNLMMYKSGTCIGLRNVYYPENNLNRMGFVCEIESSTPVVTQSPKPTTTPKPTSAPAPVPKCFTVSGSAVINNAGTEQTAAIIIAEYTGSVLKNVTSTKETFDAGQTKIFTIPQGGKIFVWDSLSGMKPLTQ